MAGYVDVVLHGDDSAVQAMIAKVEFALSPGGVTHFLGAMVDPYLRTRAANRFANEGDDVVGQWQPLAAFTQNIRASQGYGPSHPINRRTGDLENYITQSPSAITIGTDGGMLRFPGRPATGELRDKVRVAQRGNAANPTTPPRPVLGVNSRDLEAVLLGLAMHLKDYP